LQGCDALDTDNGFDILRENNCNFANETQNNNFSYVFLIVWGCNQQYGNSGEIHPVNIVSLDLAK